MEKKRLTWSYKKEDKKNEVNENIKGKHDIPQYIHGSYTTDYNICNVNTIILRKFEYEQQYLVSDLIKEIEQKRSSLNNRWIDGITWKMIDNQISEIQRKIEKINSREEYNKYIEETKDLLEEYRSLNSNPKKIVIGKKRSDVSIQRRHRIIGKYLEKASKYITINVIRCYDDVVTCEGCGTNLNDEPISDTGIQICPLPGCSRERIVFNHHNINESKNRKIKGGYEDHENFKKALHRFEGQQKTTIPEDLFDKLDAYFKTRHLMIGKEVKELPLDDRGRRGYPIYCKELLFTALQQTNNSSFYEDANLICHLYWNWELPDISHLIDIIMIDYDTTQEIFNSLELDRQSCLNTQYRLYKHLQARGYPCTSDDFKILKTTNALNFHDKTWETMCEKTGLPYFETT